MFVEVCVVAPVIEGKKLMSENYIGQNFFDSVGAATVRELAS